MKSIALLILIALTIPVAWAEPSATVDQFLGSLLAISEAKCSSENGRLAKEYEAAGKQMEAHSVRSAERALCGCMPDRARKLRSSLSKEELAVMMSESNFVQNMYKPEVLDPCVAEQARAPYSEGCADRFAAVRANSAKYCSCMSNSMSHLSDAELVQIGLESSDYLPRVADAKKRGLPPPEQPPAFKRFASIESSCAVE